MQKLFFLLSIIALLFASCKKESDDCSCPVPESKYDPDFVTFPTKDVKWVVFHWGGGGARRVDTLFIAASIPFTSRTLPYNAVDYSVYEPESQKNYYQIRSHYFTYTMSGSDTASISATQTGIYTYFRVDTAENKLYELFNGPGAKYEIEIIDWDKTTGDTLYNYYGGGMGSKNLIMQTDSTMIGKRYIKVFNSALWQGGIFFPHVSTSFWGINTSEYSHTIFIYKNDTAKILW